MAELVKFPRRCRIQGRSEPSFVVSVTPHDGLWLVVARKHSWLHLTRSEAQALAREVAEGFGVSCVVYLRGAA